MAKIGYCRVSTEEQVTALQRTALEATGCESIYEDKISGATTSRTALDACIASLQPGDTLVVWKLDRLGRSLSHLMRTIDDLKNRGIHFESITEKFDTSTPAGELLFHVIGALAQFERQMTRERVRAGLATTKANGTKLGRRQIILDTDNLAILRLHDKGHSQAEIASNVGISQSSVSRILKEIERNKNGI